jgi:protein-disulfide isomerase
MTTHGKLDPLFTPVDGIDHIRGPASAPVTLIQYADFECPNSRQAHGALRVMLPHFDWRVRFVFRHFPRPEVHPHAELAAEAAEAAAAQGKFWPMHDMLFEHRLYTDERHVLDCASKVGLDLPRYHNEMSDRVYLQRVHEHIAGGKHLGVRGTPTFFVNGVIADVTFGMEHLHEAIDRALGG